jgi:hypothetical protein
MIEYLYHEGLYVNIFLKVDFVCCTLRVYRGSLNFIIYFYFPIVKELRTYVSYCLISINNGLLVVKCYSSLVVSGFSRNEFNSLPSGGSLQN